MKNIIIGLRLIVSLTVLTGVAYPFLMTMIGEIAFPSLSRGSLIQNSGQNVGSRLIGQKFTQDKYFWGRPSAIDYNPLPSGGSNLAPTSKKLVDSVAEQSKKFSYAQSVPQDLIFASASGLDPHISIEAALIQIERVIKARGWDEGKKESIRALIREHTAPRQLGFLGEKRVNVLELNLALDKLG